MKYTLLNTFAFITLLLLFQVGSHLQAQPPKGGGNGSGSRGSGQTPTTGVNGMILDAQNNPIPYASVAIYSAKDSTLKKGAATNINGQFKIALRPGKYYASISMLAHQDKIIPDLKVQDAFIPLGKIVLEADEIALEAIDIVGEKSTMQLKLDKRVFNVGKDLASKGGNVTELLDNVPSVNVDIDGNVSLRGSENVRILIDGKPSGLVGISSTDALRQLQGSMVQSVEVITNPSARYDAEGEVGIINIVLKKERKKGLNGSFEATLGHPTNYGLSFNLNYRRKNVNLFTNYGMSYRANPGCGTQYQEFYDDNGNLFSSHNIERDHVRGGLSNTIQFGADIFLNKSNTLTVSGMYKPSKNPNEANILYEDFDSEGNLYNVTNRQDRETETGHNLEGALSYLKNFKRKGHKWTFDAKYILGDDTELVDYEEHSSFNDSTIYQRSSNTEDERNLLLQTDYVHPFGKDGKFEMGLKTTLRTISNKYTVEEEIDGQWQILGDFNDELAYTEDIYAAYIMAGNKSGKFSYQGGVRAEYSDISTELLESNTTNPRDYLDWFPSIHLAYELPQQNTIQVSYSRRISRPRFWFLLPFFTFSDSRNIFSGNPDLNPEYTNSIELGYLKNFEKGTLLSSVYYRYRTGVIERIRLVNELGETRMFPINMANQNAYGIEFNFSYNLMDWWRLNTNLDFYRAITDGEYNDITLHSDTYTWSGRLSSKFKLPKDIDLQTSFNYRAPRVTTQGKRYAAGSWDMGISKDLLKGNATLTLSAKDILNTRRRRGITETAELFSESEFQWRSRQIVMTFNYRLNQKKKRGGRGGYGGGGDY